MTNSQKEKNEKKKVTCKKCQAEMKKVYAFGENIPYQQWCCPQCGSTTAKRAIIYNDNGKLNEKKGGEVLR